MKATYSTSRGNERFFDTDNFYKDIAMMMAEESLSDAPMEILAVCEKGAVKYKMIERSDSMFITEELNTVDTEVADTDLSECMLTCVNAEKNQYKYYRLIPKGDTVTAKYGRMGAEKGQLFGERECSYSITMFWVKYYEKLAKGYCDKTSFYITEKTEAISSEKEEKPSCQTLSRKLFSTLYGFARNAVRRARVNVPITREIIEESERLLDEMRKAETVDSFNRYLLELIAILQRPIGVGRRGVKSIIADSDRDFSRIITRESDLITAMDGILAKREGRSTEAIGDFDNMEVYIATDKQKEQVMRHLSDTLKAKVKTVYRVIPGEQKKCFDRYIEKNGIEKVRLLWHGSRNQNWLSIMQNGLSLNPNAQINGKMFGYGIYFAPSSAKSWNYTSYRGTHWARGTEDVAYMGLYAVAYGKPLDVYNWNDHPSYDKALLEKHGCNSLHAHKGVSLHNDEIIVYDESAVLLQYIVEFQ